MISSSTGWQQLRCLYFAETCHEVLGDYLKEFGFSRAGLTGIGGVLYRRHDVFLEIGYEPETYPDYHPTIALGYGDEAYDESGFPNGIPMWFVLGNDATPRYTFWTFSDQESLRHVFPRIAEELLEPHAKPLWRDPERLKQCIDSFRNGLSEFHFS